MNTSRYHTSVLCALGFALACAAPERSDDADPHDETDSTSVVTLTPQQRSTAQIALAVVQLRSAVSELEATAHIEAAEDRVAHVAATVAGRIVSIAALTGTSVRAGQSLATVDSPELSRAMASYVSALAASKMAREVADKERTLFVKGISSEREWRIAESDARRAEAAGRAAATDLQSMGVVDSVLNTLETSERYNSTLALLSPISGQVTHLQGAVGQVVEAGFEMFTVVDLRQVWAIVDVYEQDLGRVRMGQSVQVRVTSHPTRTFAGVVDNVGATVEAATRTAKVRVVLANSDLLLKPGMFASVLLSSESREAPQILVVPASAVQRDAGNSVVFVALGDAKFESRAIAVGKSDSRWIEVLSGLKAGDSVVSNGAFLLKSQLRKSQLGGHPH